MYLVILILLRLIIQERCIKFIHVVSLYQNNRSRAPVKLITSNVVVRNPRAETPHYPELIALFRH